MSKLCDLVEEKHWKYTVPRTVWDIALWAMTATQNERHCHVSFQSEFLFLHLMSYYWNFSCVFRVYVFVLKYMVVPIFNRLFCFCNEVTFDLILTEVSQIFRSSYQILMGKLATIYFLSPELSQVPFYTICSHIVSFWNHSN